MEDSIKTLRDSLVAEAIASDGTSNNDHQEHITKAASFAKTLVEKEKTLKDLAGIVGKLEDEYKTFELICFSVLFHLILLAGIK